ncbi:MAG: hypothetical protein WA118_09765 [Carboxydocellales bacterium]
MIFKWSKAVLWLAGTSIIVSAATAGYLGVTKYLPLRKPDAFTQAAQASSEPRVTENTVVRLERKFLCGNVETDITPVTLDLIGLNTSQLTPKYPADEGWEVGNELPQVLVLRKAEWDVCSLHRNYRHLGNVQGVLAIYEGPLEVSKTLLQKEDIKLKALPKELRDQLKQAEKFKNQKPEVKRQLRASLEFQNDAAINEFLDNLDEYRED